MEQELEGRQDRELSDPNEARRTRNELDTTMQDTARRHPTLNEEMLTGLVIIAIEAQIMKDLEEEYRKQIAGGRITYMRRWMMKKLNINQSDESKKKIVVKETQIMKAPEEECCKESAGDSFMDQSDESKKKIVVKETQIMKAPEEECCKESAGGRFMDQSDESKEKIVVKETQIMKAPEEECCKESAGGRFMDQSDKPKKDEKDQEKEETVMDSTKQFKAYPQEKQPVETQLYSLLARLMATIHGSKDYVTSYNYFKSVLESLLQDLESQLQKDTVQTILDHLKEAEGLVRNSGSSGQQVKEGAQVKEVIDEFMNSIHLLLRIKDQVKECEDQLNRIDSKIDALLKKD